MYKPTGSWVAIPTPFNESGSIDWKGFEVLIDHHKKHGMNKRGRVQNIHFDEFFVHVPFYLFLFTYIF